MQIEEVRSQAFGFSLGDASVALCDSSSLEPMLDGESCDSSSSSPVEPLLLLSELRFGLLSLLPTEEKEGFGYKIF